jgi:hypothetical protein
MSPTAAGLAAYGRNGDSTLVHMTPGEVAGLQALAKANGTSLTINPHTGLPEAFSLESLLPTIAGAGLMMVPGMQPLAAGLLVGMGHGLATGFENPLQSVTAGLGAYGGAGIGAGLSAAGAAAPVGDAAATMGPDLTGSMALPEPPVDATMGGTYDPSRGYIGARDVADYDVSGASQQQALYNSSQAPVSFSNMGKGISGIMDTGQAGTDARSAFMSKAGEYGGLSKIGPAAIAPVAASAMEMEQSPITKPISTIRPYEFKRDVTPGAFDDLTDSRERRYFSDQFTAKEPYQLAKGGLATFARGGKAKKPDPMERLYDMADFRDPQAMQKKTMGMYQYAAGSTIRGPGDGMSDEVKANIDGVQEARLSDGEFVIPADVVSGLGNGSTEAGSKQLKEMMARVRKSRTGKTRQAPQIKVRGLMPA